MELDHVFTFVDGPREAERVRDALGLDETYRRVHPGQGTANLCCAFDDAYVELLWLTDPAEATTPRTARTRLYERSRWRQDGTCPFGIAWRGPTDPAIAAWSYAPIYLPSGVTLDIATDSDDPRQPLLFASPGNARPASWPTERRGNLQRARGLASVGRITFRVPHGLTPAPAFVLLAERLGLALEPGDRWELLLDPSPGGRSLRLPLDVGRGDSAP
jgi:hypothetical protein